MKTSTLSYRYIVKTRGVAGGRPRIKGSRIGVHTLVGLLNNGETVDSLCGSRIFPELRPAQVYEALSYYEDHRGEIDVLIAETLAPDFD